MVIDKVRELLKAVKTDPKAQEALQGLVKPADENGIIRYYAEAAKRLGYNVTEADLRETLTEAAKERAEKTESMAADIQALPDEALERTSGGINTRYIDHHDECVSAVGDWMEIVECYSSFEDRENCWQHDACDSSQNRYSGYLCGQHYNGRQCQSKEQFDCGAFIF